jgi:hypothetical protein
MKSLLRPHFSEVLVHGTRHVANIDVQLYGEALTLILSAVGTIREIIRGEEPKTHLRSVKRDLMDAVVRLDALRETP